MSASISSLVPNADDLLSLEVEEVAWILLTHLRSLSNSGRGVMRTHTGVIDETNPIMRYKVSDEHGQEVAFITDTRASGRPAGWQIFHVKDGIGIGESTGDYTTAEDALSALRKEFDN